MYDGIPSGPAREMTNHGQLVVLSFYPVTQDHSSSLCGIFFIKAKDETLRAMKFPETVLYKSTFVPFSTTPGIPARFSFNSLKKILSVTRQELDTLLSELNKQRFISQYAKKGVDSFTVVINQKGLDAVLDESFL